MGQTLSVGAGAIVSSILPSAWTGVGTKRRRHADDSETESESAVEHRPQQPNYKRVRRTEPPPSSSSASLSSASPPLPPVPVDPDCASCCHLASEVQSLHSLLTSSSASQCAVCHYILIEPLTLDCSHSFCSRCILQAVRRQPHCPLCRARITRAPPKASIHLRNLLDVVISHVSNEDERRERLAELRVREVEQRQNGVRFIEEIVQLLGLNTGPRLPIFDRSDNIWRCPYCSHEVHKDDQCCGLIDWTNVEDVVEEHNSEALEEYEIDSMFQQAYRSQRWSGNVVIDHYGQEIDHDREPDYDYQSPEELDDEMTEEINDDDDAEEGEDDHDLSEGTREAIAAAEHRLADRSIPRAIIGAVPPHVYHPDSESDEEPEEIVPVDVDVGEEHTEDDDIQEIYNELFGDRDRGSDNDSDGDGSDAENQLFDEYGPGPSVYEIDDAEFSNDEGELKY